MTRFSLRWIPLALAGALMAASGAACRSPTLPSGDLQTQTFTGILQVGGLNIQTFDVIYAAAPTDASVTLTSLVTAANQTPVTTTLGIGFGEPRGTSPCVLRQSHSTTQARLNQELVASGIFAPGTWCVGIFDAGTLTEPVIYTIVVQHF